MRISIGIITYLRPAGLERLLRSLNALTFEYPPPELDVVVVDNDPNASARAVCERFRPASRWPLTYVTEPRRGIPQARNRVVQEAADANFIAFIDDDEVPTPDWLNRLLHAQRTYSADVVSGPVLPVFPDEGMHWMARSGFFDRPRYPTGHATPHFATNNVLIRTAVLHAVDGPFDERLALTGGSDTMLARQLHQQGCTMVWADEAHVHEWVPASRLRPTWLLKRTFRGGLVASLTDLNTGGSIGTRIGWGLRGSARVLQGLLLLLPLLVRGQRGLLWALRQCSLGAGMLAGLYGLRYDEYRTIHGS